MVANILVIAFVSVFCGIALFGHWLVLTAIWPNLIPNQRSDRSDAVAPDHDESTEEAMRPPQLAA